MPESHQAQNGADNGFIGVGKNNFKNNYIKSLHSENIFYKEHHYSELVFHYWFWKNQLK